MPRCVIQAVADHISAAQATKPSLLTRVGPIDAVNNRYDALKGLNLSASLKGMFSMDEYPFASSRQGGRGASVQPVPIRQNAIQGGIIGACYVMEKIGVGDQFYVVVLP